MGARQVYLLDFGTITDPIGMFLPSPRPKELEKKYPSANLTISVSGVLVVHKKGIVLFDTGFSPTAGLRFPVKFRDKNRIEYQLGLLGLEPKNVDLVCLSHLHFDHVGQVAAFKDLGIPVVVHEKELQYALSMLWQGKGGGYTADDLLPLRGVSWHPIGGDQFTIFDGVELLWTGAHTPGHMVLSVETNSKKSFVFTGDFIHLFDQYETETAGWLMGDSEEYHSYIRKLKLMIALQGRKLVVGHDPHLWDTYPKAPKPIG